MCRYKKIDLEHWARKEHYLYYTNSLNVEVCELSNSIEKINSEKLS